MASPRVEENGVAPQPVDLSAWAGIIASVAIGGVITAMVTPFDETGRLSDEASARLVRHLLASGSDALVLAGTTGEASTLAD